MKIKCIFLTVFLLAVASVGFAQPKPKTDQTIEAAMKNFINSIETKNTAVFLSYVSPTKGLTVMNTIDQGEEGNEDKPMLDSKLEYKKLAADFKKKGTHYRDIFLPSPDSPNFHDGFAKRKEKWKLVNGDKFQLVDADTGKPSNAFYIKLEKSGDRWFVTEVGRLIS
jgi:hypothetical protein